jgi:fumarylacetoacetate (FAA) hydrolase family protein
MMTHASDRGRNAMADTETLQVPAEKLTAQATLPEDWKNATLVGRVMRPDAGPSLVYVNSEGFVIDISKSFPSSHELCEQDNPAAAAKKAAETGEPIGRIEDILKNSAARSSDKPYMLSPFDFQEIEAAGVTFLKSLIERMIDEAARKTVAEEKAKRPKDGPAMSEEEEGRLTAQTRERINKEVTDIVGPDFHKVEPGSEPALAVLEHMRKRGLSMVYPTVGLSRKGEIFPKAAPATSVGHGAQAGFASDSNWNTPEPEMVLAVNSKGKIVGATLGNDISDRKLEGDSPVYLPEAKIGKGSSAIGPFIRLFDDKFTLNDAKSEQIRLQVHNPDKSLKYEGVSNMSLISRPLEWIAAQAMGASHHHPTGVGIYTGTMIVPDVDDKNQKFTYAEGDTTTIHSPKLGGFTNVLVHAEKVQGLENGAYDLARNLFNRGLILPNRGGFVTRTARSPSEARLG